VGHNEYLGDVNMASEPCYILLIEVLHRVYSCQEILSERGIILLQIGL